MPDPSPTITADDVRIWAESLGDGAASGDAVGVEVEWLTFDSDDHRVRVPVERMRDVIGEVLPRGSAVTFEPGGQVELSSACWATLDDACGQIGEDASFITERLIRDRISLVGLGADPVRPDQRLIRSSRYDAMAAYFGLRNGAGARMMCSTAAVQVNVDAGHGEERTRRWRLAHDLLPVLAGMFACSPLERGLPTGWMSSRLAAWAAIDPTRTRRAWQGADVTADWFDYVMAADVMLMATRDGGQAAQPPGLTFERWVTEGHDLGFPTVDDLAYHATTLFPPVRYRGWLEIRIADALPGRGWAVVAALATALLIDPEASARAEQAVTSVAHLDIDARRGGLDHPALARAARTCAMAGLEALPRIGGGSVSTDVEAFIERFTARGRCPADEVIDVWARHGSPVDARRLAADIEMISWP